MERLGSYILMFVLLCGFLAMEWQCEVGRRYKNCIDKFTAAECNGIINEL